jgi:hypothetical protein
MDAGEIAPLDCGLQTADILNADGNSWAWPALVALFGRAVE